MVKAYLNYEQSATFGLTASPTANVQLLPGVGPRSSSSSSSDLIWCCCGSEAALWHTRQRQRLLRLQPPAVVSPEGETEVYRQRASVVAAAASAAAVAVGYGDGSILVWRFDVAAAAAAALQQQPEPLGPPCLVLQGHRGAVNALQWACSSSSSSSGSSSSSTEDLLLSGGCDGDIIVWDSEGGMGRFRLRGHTQPVTALLPIYPKAAAAAAAAAVAAEGAKSRRKETNNNSSSSSLLLISGSKDGLVKIWDPELQLCLHTTLEAAEAAEVWTLAVNTCQTRLFVGGGDSKVRIFALHLTAAAGPRTTYLGAVSPNRSSKKQRIRQLQFLPIGDESAAAAAATAAATAAAAATTAAAGPPVLVGGLLLCCSGGSRIVDCFRCFDAAELQHLQQKRGRRALQRQKKKQQQQQDEEDQKQLQQQQLSEAVFVGSLHADAVVKGFHARLARCKSSSSGKAAAAAQHSSSSSGGLSLRICLNLNNNALELWTVSPSLLRKPQAGTGDAFTLAGRLSSGGHAGQIRSLALSHDDGYVLSAADEGAKIWSVSSARCVKTLPCEEPQCGFVVAGNEHIVLGCRNGELLLFDVGAVALLQRDAAHAAAINALAEHPNHTGFASASSDKTVKLFVFHLAETATSQEQKQQQQVGFRCAGSFSMPDEALDVAFDPQGKYVIAALIDHTILVLHSDTGRIRLSLYGHKLPVTCLSVSSSGLLLVSGSVDKSIKLWGLDFGDIRKSFRAHDDAVTKVVFLPSTHYVLSVSLDGTIKLWDGDKHLLIKVFACGASSKGNEAAFRGAPLVALCVSADGDAFCCCDSNRQLHLWQRTNEQVFEQEQREKRLLQQQQQEAEGIEEAAATAAAAASAAAATVVLNRPTKRTDETLKSADKLIEALQVAREQREEDEAFAVSFFRWANALGSSKSAAAAAGTAAAAATAGEPMPLPPPARAELLGRSANEHLVRCLYAIKTAEAAEVMLALPLDYALELLQFLTELLEKEAQRLLETKRARDDQQQQQQVQQPSLFGPTELAVRLALQLVQLHFKLFIASDKHRTLIHRLRSVARPLLLQQRDALRFNSAAMNVLLRCMGSSGSEALQQLKQQVSVKPQPSKKKRKALLAAY
ncbi:hypothetical protein Esti_004184 [Eimeria stiedai]